MDSTILAAFIGAAATLIAGIAAAVILRRGESNATQRHMPSWLVRTVVTLNAVATGLVIFVALLDVLINAQPSHTLAASLAGASAVYKDLLPNAWRSGADFFGVIVVLVSYAFPFGTAYEAYGGFKGRPAQFSYSTLIANAVFLALVVMLWRNSITSSRSDDFSTFLLFLAPLSLFNFISLIVIPKDASQETPTK